MLRFLSTQMWPLKDMNHQGYLWLAQLHMLLEQRPGPQTLTLPWHVLKAYPLWGQVQCSPVSEEYWKGTRDHVCVCAHVFCSVISNTKKNQLLLYAGTHAVTNPPESAIVLGFKNENDLEYLRMTCVRRFIFWPSAATYNI